MQLKRYKLFLKNLREEIDFINAVAGFEIYRKCDTDWFDTKETKVDDDNLKKALERTLARTAPWRRRNSTQSFFPISKFHAVVTTKSASPTRRSTRNKMQQTLSDISKRATTEFNAIYDGLTGLLNSRSLEEKIREALEASSASIESASAEIKTTTSTALRGQSLVKTCVH